MAKLNARNFKELARITTTFESPDLTEPARYIWVLRTDGKVLRRTTGEYGSGYSILGVVKVTPSVEAQNKHRSGTKLLVRIAEKRGHVVEKEF